MKEATGDMTMTIVVIVGIVAVLSLATTVIWPRIREKITGEIDGINDIEIEAPGGGGDGGALGGGYIILSDYFNN